MSLNKSHRYTLSSNIIVRSDPYFKRKFIVNDINTSLTTDINEMAYLILKILEINSLNIN